MWAMRTVKFLRLDLAVNPVFILPMLSLRFGARV